MAGEYERISSGGYDIVLIPIRNGDFDIDCVARVTQEFYGSSDKLEKQLEKADEMAEQLQEEQEDLELQLSTRGVNERLAFRLGQINNQLQRYQDLKCEVNKQLQDKKESIRRDTNSVIEALKNGHEPTVCSELVSDVFNGCKHIQMLIAGLKNKISERGIQENIISLVFVNQRLYGITPSFAIMEHGFYAFPSWFKASESKFCYHILGENMVVKNGFKHSILYYSDAQAGWKDNGLNKAWQRFSNLADVRISNKGIRVMRMGFHSDGGFNVSLAAK